MIKSIPCIYNYISQTKKGDRNSNFFKAINHLRQFNRESSLEEIVIEALKVNNMFQDKLSEQEVKTVCQHVCKTTYYSSCHNFTEHCRHCQYGHNRKPYKDILYNGWKILNKDNTIKTHTVGLPKGKYYLWDFTDTSKLTDEDKLKVMRLRESKGINPSIDEVLKLKGFKVGDAALKHFLKYLEKGE